MWVAFDSKEAFDTWHNDLCKQLDYPKPSENQFTGEIDLTATMTKAYAEAIPAGDKFIVNIEDEYSTGLTPTDLRPPTLKDLLNDSNQL
jgi:hypothetical protein